VTLSVDACALIAYLRREPGAEVVHHALVDPANTCLVHAVNMCEVFYDFLRASDRQTADEAVRDLLRVGFQLRRDMSMDFWKESGVLKTGGVRISLADCFCVALARRENAVVLTSDHHEFDRVVTAGLCTVQFIR
jgi:PIN domain nuclease of toxin-antitoxin system